MIKYTQQEIDTNVNTLTKLMDILKEERTILSQNINSHKKQIEYWRELDQSQIKMF